MEELLEEPSLHLAVLPQVVVQFELLELVVELPVLLAAELEQLQV
jgi:hypothetical protein